ncbi:MAG: PilN domain-containing protein [Pseudomonadales bacterium]
MANINLRAWRDERDLAQQKNFVVHIAFAALLAVAVIFAVGKYYDFQQTRQADRTAYLKTQIAQLKTKIKEIENLKSLKVKRLARLKTIKQLQGNRPLIVRYIDELIKVIPDSLYYTSLVRTGDRLALKGLADRNQDVSKLMRSINASSWFGEPNLTNVGGSSGSRSFDLIVPLAKGGAQ